ncbi:TIGR03936 family radical SAM-associated protein [Clostridium akagii]|uniref:TIGR03936 family radical SAM-associated protein n=1 Tax=Clostridium akagii TaxID=91623 RepID=UPI001FA77807|nr:TIGR03936 family radical SAM-associated protein [Clostridium akagii]
MRYSIKFKKGPDIKFVAHLDLMRALQRTFKRAALPVEYSNGFNPHMRLSIAQPLSVGMHSTGEYLDIEFGEEVDCEEIKERFNKKSTDSLKLLKVVGIKESCDKDGKKIPQSMSAVDSASYEIRIKYEDTNGLEEKLLQLSKEDQWNIIKKTKSGEKDTNIRPMVREFKFEIKNNVLIINATISCGSRENLSSELVSEYIKTHTNNVEPIAFTEIIRKEIYGARGTNIIPLWEYFEKYTD